MDIAPQSNTTASTLEIDDESGFVLMDVSEPELDSAPLSKGETAPAQNPVTITTDLSRHVIDVSDEAPSLAESALRHDLDITNPTRLCEWQVQRLTSFDQVNHLLTEIDLLPAEVKPGLLKQLSERFYSLTTGDHLSAFRQLCIAIDPLQSTDRAGAFYAIGTGTDSDYALQLMLSDIKELPRAFQDVCVASLIAYHTSGGRVLSEKKFLMLTSATSRLGDIDRAECLSTLIKAIPTKEVFDRSNVVNLLLKALEKLPAAPYADLLSAFTMEIHAKHSALSEDLLDDFLKATSALPDERRLTSLLNLLSYAARHPHTSRYQIKTINAILPLINKNGRDLLPGTAESLLENAKNNPVSLAFTFIRHAECENVALLAAWSRHFGTGRIHETKDLYDEYIETIRYVPVQNQNYLLHLIAARKLEFIDVNMALQAHFDILRTIQHGESTYRLDVFESLAKDLPRLLNTKRYETVIESYFSAATALADLDDRVNALHYVHEPLRQQYDNQKIKIFMKYLVKAFDTLPAARRLASLQAFLDNDMQHAGARSAEQIELVARPLAEAQESVRLAEKALLDL